MGVKNLKNSDILVGAGVEILKNQLNQLKY